MKKRNLLKALLAASVLCAASAFAAEGTAAVKGNPKSKVYHTSQCRHYSAKNTTKEFVSAAKAKEAGYTACKQCAGKKKKAEQK